jgi:hypothetical protein
MDRPTTSTSRLVATISCVALATLLACGCVPSNYENGFAPHLVVDGPQGSNEMDYWGADFAVDWKGMSVDLTVAARSRETTLVSFMPMFRIGWLLTGYPQEGPDDSYWWIVFKMGWGGYVWGETDTEIGACASTRAGFGCHLNDFNTIGLEYCWMTLGATGEYEDATMDGLYLMYSLEF